MTAASARLADLARSLARGLVRCPGCARRPAGRRGCCEPCWASMIEPLRTADVVALGRYRGSLGAVLRAAKFGGASSTLDALGDLLGDRMGDAGLAGLPVVPVPSHRARRRRRRGADPAARLAERAAPGRSLAALSRVRHGPPQSRTAHGTREANVAGAFGLSPAVAATASRGRVVLLDDVLTTGATARECAAVLERAGFRVAALVVVALS